MDCKAASELIMKYLDKDITKEEEETLYSHIRFCEECRLEFETLKDACLIIEDIGLEDPPADLEMAVVSRIRREEAEAAWKKNWTIGAIAALAIIAGWLGLTYMFLYTPVIETITVCFNRFLSLTYELLEFVGELWRGGFSAAVKLLTLGRALSVVQMALMEMYSIVIIAMILLMAVVLRLYGYMFKTIIRR